MIYKISVKFILKILYLNDFEYKKYAWVYIYNSTMNDSKVFLYLKES